MLSVVHTAGPLVIVGGALSDDNSAVFEAFFEGMRTGDDAKLVIVPAASGFPTDSANHMHQAFTRYGMAPDRIVTAPLAVIDDPTTDHIDESAWRHNANNAELVSLFEQAAGIWFVGGDQDRITEVLLEQGKPTAVLAAIYRAHAGGAVIGGTSAGAAIMSNPMIMYGETLPSLLGTGSRDDSLTIGPGLGFFTYGLVDQHFDARSRLGRLVVALEMNQGADIYRGFGVDENTAMLVASDGTIGVAGAGAITLLDTSKASFARIDGTLRADGILISMMTEGDTYLPQSSQIVPAAFKTATVGNEHVRAALPESGGMALPQSTTINLLGEGLVDNRAATQLERVGFDAAGGAVVYRFSQLESSRGYSGNNAAGVGKYSILDVGFEIRPARVSVEQF